MAAAPAFHKPRRSPELRSAPKAGGMFAG